MAWLGLKYRDGREQQRIVNELATLGATVGYEQPIASYFDGFLSPKPNWLDSNLGYVFLHSFTCALRLRQGR